MIKAVRKKGRPVFKKLSIQIKKRKNTKIMPNALNSIEVREKYIETAEADLKKAMRFLIEKEKELTKKYNELKNKNI